MNFQKEFNRIMVSQNELALATSVDNIPNVRIINFYYNISRKGVLYFSTFSDNSKVQEFSKNDIVAFTTIPHTGNEHIRVNNATLNALFFYGKIFYICCPPKYFSSASN